MSQFDHNLFVSSFFRPINYFCSSSFAFLEVHAYYLNVLAFWFALYSPNDFVHAAAPLSLAHEDGFTNGSSSNVRENDGEFLGTKQLNSVVGKAHSHACACVCILLPPVLTV